MVVNDESFFNILGNEVSRSGLVQQMIDYYQEKLSLGETQVTDFNEGSEIRNLLEAISVDLYSLMEDNYEVSKIAFIPTAYGEWLDAHGSNPLIRLERNQGTEAIGMVTFSIPEAITTDMVIGEGTIILGEENGLQYETNGECVIVAGTTSADVLVSCLTVGTEGNSPANTLIIIDDTEIDSSVSVTNAEPIINGTDYEDDDTYRQRLLDFQRQSTFGSLAYYQNLGDSIEGVHDVLLIHDADYTRKILVNGDSKPLPDPVMVNVLTEFTDTNNIVLGHSFIVEEVDYTTIGEGFEISINTMQELTTEEINELLSCVFNGGTTANNFDFDGLSINENLPYGSLENAFLTNFDTITSISFLLDGETFSELATDTNTVLFIDVENVTVNQIVEE